MLHTAEVVDICDHTHIFRGLTLDEIHGRVGPRWPIVLDGIPGHLTAPDGFVRFVPASPPN